MFRRKRGFIDVQVVWGKGASLRITTLKTRSLTPEQVVAELRKRADEIEGYNLKRETPAPPQEPT